MNKRKFDALVVNYKLNINIDDFDNFYSITIHIVIKYKPFMKSFIYLYNDNKINVNVIVFQCLRNVMIGKQVYD